MLQPELMETLGVIRSVEYIYGNAPELPQASAILGNSGRLTGPEAEMDVLDALQKGREVEGKFFETYFVHTKSPRLIWVAQVHGAFYPQPSVEYYVVDDRDSPERVGYHGKDYASNLGFKSDWYYRSGFAIERPEFGEIKAPYSPLLPNDFDKLKQTYRDQPGLRLLLAAARASEAVKAERIEAVIGSRALAGTFLDLRRKGRAGDIVMATQVLGADSRRPELEYMILTNGIGLAGHVSTRFMDDLGLIERKFKPRHEPQETAAPLPEFGRIELNHPTVSTADLSNLEAKYAHSQEYQGVEMLSAAVRSNFQGKKAA